MKTPTEDSPESPRQRLLLDEGWAFHNGDLPVDHWGKIWKTATYRHEPGIGRNYDDRVWPVVNLPHDFSLDGPLDTTRGLACRGYLPAGVGWYRRRFTLPEEWRDRRVVVHFEGVYRDSTCYLNEFHLGRHPSGYVPVRYDVGPMLDFGRENVLAVRVDGSTCEGYWYEGTGLYRHVWLIATDRLHIPENGVFVHGHVNPDHPLGPARVQVQVELANHHPRQAGADVALRLLTPTGEEIAHGAGQAILESMGETRLDFSFRVENPVLWSLEDPALYRVVVEVSENGRACDRVESPCGIRSAVFDANRGFLLNGVPVKIQGACCHLDFGGLGYAVPDSIHRYRVRLLKEFGFNAHRTSHFMTSPALLDACDQEGMLVFAETRQCGSAPEALAELRELIRAERSRPSVILWGLGNEEEHLQALPQAAPVLATMKKIIRSLDPTRPVTMGLNTHHEVPDGPASVLDVVGFNYTWDQWDAIRALYPDRPFIETEQANTYTTRGMYVDHSDQGYLLAYDRGHFWIRLTFTEAEVTRLMARPWMAGGFLWTGFDYRGEPLPYMDHVWKMCERTDPMPAVMSSHFGVFDTCGIPKDIAWYFKAWYGSAPVLHLFPHWNWPGREGNPVEVWCYSNADEVELSLNGRVIGRQPVPRFGHVTWEVPYAPGTIEAVSFTGGKETLRTARETTGSAVSLRLTAEMGEVTANAEDCLIASVDAVDSAGRHVPTENRLVGFAVAGPMRILGVNNGDPASRERDKAEQRHLFAGLARVILQATDTPGEARLTATAEGLAPASLVIPVRAGTRRPFLPSPVRAPWSILGATAHPAAPAPAPTPPRDDSPFEFYQLNSNTNPEKAD